MFPVKVHLTFSGTCSPVAVRGGVGFSGAFYQNYDCCQLHVHVYVPNSKIFLCTKYIFHVQHSVFIAMPDAIWNLGASADMGKEGPDYFTYYIHEVERLLSEDDNFLPFASELAGDKHGVVKGKETFKHNNSSSGSPFSDSAGSGLSDYKRERLVSLLQQALTALTPEVDEMLEPVVAMQNLRSQLRSKTLVSECRGSASENNVQQVAHKKPEMSSFSSSTSTTTLASPRTASKSTDSKYSDFSFPEKGVSNVVQKECAHGSNTSTRIGPEHNRDDDLQFLLKSDHSIVEEMLKKHSDELLTTLDHMEKQLEELLDVVVSTCRPMTLSEKRQLQKLIQNLPPKNLNRVVELIGHKKQVETQNQDDFLVDLEQEDNVTLWRLYYHVEAVEKAKNLSK